MDITYVSNRKKFNYRVCAIIISNNKILAMHDERSPYFYLPGGRVQMGETAEHAVVREVEEELNITPKIIRPLWLNQSFFTEDVDKLNYHEICIYYLMDISETGLLEKGERFTLNEGHHIHDFEWLAFERLQDEYFYPIFLKTNIYNLGRSLNADLRKMKGTSVILAHLLIPILTSESNDSTIITHIKNIRSKFADYNYTPIKTVWGIGYKWEE